MPRRGEPAGADPALERPRRGAARVAVRRPGRVPGPSARGVGRGASRCTFGRAGRGGHGARVLRRGGAGADDRGIRGGRAGRGSAPRGAAGRVLRLPRGAGRRAGGAACRREADPGGGRRRRDHGPHAAARPASRIRAADRADRRRRAPDARRRQHGRCAGDVRVGQGEDRPAPGRHGVVGPGPVGAAGQGAAPRRGRAGIRGGDLSASRVEADRGDEEHHHRA